MAVVTTNVLSMTFTTDNGSSKTWKVTNFNPEAPAIAIKDLVNGFISNGSIFANVPILAKSAKIVATTSTDVEID